MTLPDAVQRALLSLRSKAGKKVTEEEMLTAFDVVIEAVYQNPPVEGSGDRLRKAAEQMESSLKTLAIYEDIKRRRAQEHPLSPPTHHPQRGKVVSV